jgi:hypothetical protein
MTVFPAMLAPALAVPAVAAGNRARGGRGGTRRDARVIAGSDDPVSDDFPRRARHEAGRRCR